MKGSVATNAQSEVREELQVNGSLVYWSEKDERSRKNSFDSRVR